jgi:hypothetical protein
MRTRNARTRRVTAPHGRCFGGFARCALVALGTSLGCASPVPFDAPACVTCVTRVTKVRVAFPNEDQHDLLFVVDDSPSMAQEQQTLQRELPRLVQRLLDGRNADGSPRSSPIANANIGVVSADLGTAGVADADPGCDAWGDDALLRHASSSPGCDAEYPLFLENRARAPLASSPSTDTPQSIAADFACVASAGTTGCAYAQPLESALAALWPASDAFVPRPNLSAPIEPTFLGERTPGGTLGHGEGAHQGFLRNEPRNGLSLVSVVIVTDQDDCSVADPSFFAPSADGQSPAARCAASPASLFPIARYVEGLRGLRPGNEQLVLLHVIAGVPEDLVATVPDDFSDNAASQDRFYEALLGDSRMQPRARADGTLAPACESEGGSATPARRLVEAARGFGGNARVLSICQSDWSAIVDRTIEVIARQIGAVCLPRPIPRASSGLVDCDVVWELPLAGAAPDGTPTRCDQLPGLLTLDAHPPVTDDGGQRCIVRQLAVTGPPGARVVEPGFGWFLDDFSEDARRECTTTPKQRVAFGSGAEPRSGMQASLECVETWPLVPQSGALMALDGTPELFDRCHPIDPGACARALEAIEPEAVDLFDRTLICHPAHQVCVLPCADADCPTGWTCNRELGAFCEPGECRVPG